MFIPIYILNQNNKDGDEVRNRWEENEEQYKYVIEQIKKGAGEHFLGIDFELGKLDILKDQHDLRGIKIVGKDLDFKEDMDNFKSIDFSYSEFIGSRIKNCTFYSNYFEYAKFYGCTFEKCTFYCCKWLGCSFNKCKFVNCDFVESTSMHNCDLHESTFNVFCDQALFVDCRFDIGCYVNEPQKKPNCRIDEELNPEKISDIYASISSAYKNGSIDDKGRDYYYRSRKARTRNNSKGLTKFGNKLIEILTGYGVKPIRPIISLFIVIVIFTGIFLILTGNFYDAFLMSISALLTSGNAACYPLPFNMLYYFEGFLGISLLSLYITVLANVWFSK